MTSCVQTPLSGMHLQVQVEFNALVCKRFQVMTHGGECVWFKIQVFCEICFIAKRILHVDTASPCVRSEPVSCILRTRGSVSGHVSNADLIPHKYRDAGQSNFRHLLY